jgi:hypothetical protein
MTLAFAPRTHDEIRHGFDEIRDAVEDFETWWDTETGDLPVGDAASVYVATQPNLPLVQLLAADALIARASKDR